MLLRLVYLTILAFLAGVILLLRPRRRFTAPACPHCHYDVTGLPGPICPECGSNLDVIGALKPGSRMPRTPLTRATIWTLLLPLPALILSALLEPLVPRRYTEVKEVALDSPASAAYQHVAIRSYWDGYVRPYRFTRIQVWFFGRPLQGRSTPLSNLTIERDGSVTWHPPLDAQPVMYLGNADLDTILACLASVGADTTDERVRVEAASVLNGISAARTNELPPAVVNLRMQYSVKVLRGGRPAWGGLLAVLAWFLIWLRRVVSFLRAGSPPVARLTELPA
jgi:hypothetical protein